jgi:parallel beta-helix repeat protein
MPAPSFKIQNDGTITPSTQKIQRNGETYIFLGDVEGSICVEKDSIVIDGAGFLLNADNKTNVPGIDLKQSHNVTVKEVTVAINGLIGINLSEATEYKIIDNRLVGTTAGLSSLENPANSTLKIGLLLRRASNGLIDGNIVTNCNTGIFLDSAYDNVLVDNKILDCATGISFANTTTNFLHKNNINNNDRGVSYKTFPVSYPLSDSIDTSNTVDGKPIHYLINQQNVTVPPDAAHIVLANCTNIVIRNSNPDFILLSSTTNSTISNVTITKEIKDVGIALTKCSNVNILRTIIKNHNMGIILESASENQIANCTISNCNGHGINFESSNRNLICGNNFTGDRYGVALYTHNPSTGNIFSDNYFADNEEGIMLCDGNSVSRNTFVRNNYGIYFLGGENNITGNVFRENNRALSICGENNNFKDNKLENNTYSFYITDLAFTDPYNDFELRVVHNTIDTSNTVDGKPVYYWTNKHDKTVPLNASCVILVSCKNITVQNLSLSGNSHGIVLIYTTNTTIKNNSIHSNGFYGIGIFASSKNTVTENTIKDNYGGMGIANSYKNTITQNVFSENKDFAMIFSGTQKDNVIHHNDFLENKGAPMLQVSIDKRSGFGWGNVWDDGTEGNYWSDYTTRYLNASEAQNIGIGNTPFVINENNVDRHPLLAPFNVTNTEVTVITSGSPQPIATPNLTSASTRSPAQSPSSFPSPTVPEFPTWMLTAFLTTVVIALATLKLRCNEKGTPVCIDVLLKERCVLWES